VPLFTRRSDRSASTDRSESDTTPAAGGTAEQGKGRATPTRKEAEARRKEQLKPALTRKEQAARDRQARANQRASMLAGDEASLMPRDRGPVRRAVREYVDGRFSAGELFLPGALVILALGFFRSEVLQRFSLLLWFLLMAVILIDFVVLYLGLRRHLSSRFEASELSGTTFYAIMRALQIRRLRVPKTTRRIGDNRRARTSS
jgi:hypothetical protein